MLEGFRLGVIACFIVAIFVVPARASAQTPGSFSTIWDSGIDGASGNEQIFFPYTNQVGQSEVYWELVSDSTINGTTSIGVLSNAITFPAEGVYRVDIVDYFPDNTFVADANGDGNKLLAVAQWGDDPLSTMEDIFRDAENLVGVPLFESPDLSAATSLENAFSGALMFNQSINHWDVSNITTMKSAFDNAAAFNQPLDDWTVSNVADFSGMFNATPFNQPLNDWNMSSATNTNSMFSIALDFNQPLDNWDMSSVEDMAYMFYLTEAFNQPLNDWDTSSLQTTEGMFSYSSAFNQSVGNWDLSNISLTPAPSGASGMITMFEDSVISLENYSDTLIGWADSVIVPAGINLGTVGSTGFGGTGLVDYFSTAQTARDTLVVTNGWTINDGDPIAAFNLTYGTTVNAILSGDGVQTVASGTPGTAVTVVPNQGYEFVQWSDGNTDNPRIDTPTTNSVSVIAEVVKIQSGSNSTRVGVRTSDNIDPAVKTYESDRPLITSEGIAILNLSPEELEGLPDDQKRQVIDILLTLIAILTEILTQMMVGAEK